MVSQTHHSGHHLKEKFIVFIGSYAEPTETGIYVYSLDTSSGELNLLDGASGLKNPSFLDIDHQGKRIYAISQAEVPGQETAGSAAAYAFDPESGQLTLLNEELTVARPTCHIHFNAAGKYVLTSSYHGGLVGISSILEDGRLDKVNEVHQHEGQLGPNTARQDRPHPHSAFVDPDQRYVYVPDLGLDCIRIYEVHPREMKLRPIGEAKSAPGAGPRHLTFHPDQPIVYVINELDSTISVYRRNQETGSLEMLQTVSTLPDTFTGDNTCAEIHISSNGRFVYGSNRGHDSIALFEVDVHSGQLTFIETVSSGGQLPRNFALSPDDQFLLAAHQETGNLVVFRIDSHTGRLQETGHSAEAPGGVCVKFWDGPVNLL